MEYFLSFLGALVSMAAAAVAWFFNYEVKKYEIEQKHLTEILKSRFNSYPSLWKLVNKFYTETNKGNLLEKTNQLQNELLEHKLEYGVFYSENIRSEVSDSNKAIISIINGENIERSFDKLINSILRLEVYIQDDLGAYATLPSAKRGKLKKQYSSIWD